MQGVIARFAAQSYEKGGICGGRVVAMFLGIDPRELSQGGPMDDSPYVSVPPTPLIREASVGNDELRDFVSVVLADTEDTWEEVFQVRYVSDGSAMIMSVGPGKKANPHPPSTLSGLLCAQ